MKLVFKVDEDDKSKLQNILDEDPVSRLSISQKNAKALDLEMEGVLTVLEGAEDSCEKAREELSKFAEELEDEEKKKVVESIEAAEKEAEEGFGSIFG